MKRVVSTILAVLLVAALFTGCSNDEKGFYNTAKEIAAQKDYSFSGDLSAKVNKLEANGDDESEETSSLNEIKDLLNGTTFTYDGSVSSTKNTIAFNLHAKNGSSSVDVVNLMADSTYLYVTKSVADEIFPVVAGSSTVTENGVTYMKYDITALLTEIEDATSAFDSEPDTNPYTSDIPSLGYYDGYTAGYNDGYSLCSLGENYDYGINQDYENNTSYLDAYKKGYAAGYPKGGVAEETDSENKALNLQVYEPLLEEFVKYNQNQASYADLQAKLTASLDKFVNDLCDGTELGLVKKVGDSKYEASLNKSNVTAAVNTLGNTIATKLDKFKSLVTDFVNSLTLDEYNELFSGISKTDLLKDIAGLTASDFTNLAGNKTVSSEASSDSGEGPVIGGEEDLSDIYDTNLDVTLEKTGSQSYDMGCTATITTKDTENAPLLVDMSVSYDFNMNPDKAHDIGTTVAATPASSGAGLTLTVTDANAQSCGILLSSNADMSGATKLAASKSGSAYQVDVSSLTPSTKYYYEPYIVDASGNLLTGAVQNFTTAAAAPVSSAVSSTVSSAVSSSVSSAAPSSAVSDTASDSSTVSEESSSQAAASSGTSKNPNTGSSDGAAPLAILGVAALAACVAVGRKSRG